MAVPREQVQVRAHAKVNLTLEVLGRREDGFHELRTVFQTVSLFDDVELRIQTPARHILGGSPAWLRSIALSDLGLRAQVRYAQMVVEDVRERFSSVTLQLDKRVPPAAGLGGGSSDAAAVLRGLEVLNPAPLGEPALLSIAAELGSDVAFFLRGGTQLAAGRGELLTPLPDIPLTFLVLVTPPLSIEQKTAAMFRLLRPEDFSDGTRSERLVESFRAGAAPQPALLFNVFDRVADLAFEGLSTYRHALQQRCGHAVLSGAGPSLYAIASGAKEAVRAAEFLRSVGVPAQVVAAIGAEESTRAA